MPEETNKTPSYRIIVKDYESKDKKQKFKAYKLVDEENNGKLVDCVLCKTCNATLVAQLNECHKATVTGVIQISNNYEYPKAFIRSIEKVDKIN